MPLAFGSAIPIARRPVKSLAFGTATLLARWPENRRSGR
jgi:hypothetical protein